MHGHRAERAARVDLDELRVAVGEPELVGDEVRRVVAEVRVGPAWIGCRMREVEREVQALGVLGLDVGLGVLEHRAAGIVRVGPVDGAADARAGAVGQRDGERLRAVARVGVVEQRAVGGRDLSRDVRVVAGDRRVVVIAGERLERGRVGRRRGDLPGLRVEDAPAARLVVDQVGGVDVVEEAVERLRRFVIRGKPRRLGGERRVVGVGVGDRNEPHRRAAHRIGDRLREQAANDLDAEPVAPVLAGDVHDRRAGSDPIGDRAPEIDARHEPRVRRRLRVNHAFSVTGEPPLSAPEQRARARPRGGVPGAVHVVAVSGMRGRRIREREAEYDEAARQILHPPVIGLAARLRSQMGFQSTTYSVQSGVATIALDQPETRNALSDELLDELLAAFEPRATTTPCAASCSPRRTRRSSPRAATSAGSRPTCR